VTPWLVTGVALFIALVAVAPTLGTERYTGPERRKPLPPGVSLPPDIVRRRIGYERRRIDRDFGVLIVVALLGSPLGWLYYTPMLLPALATRWYVWRELPTWQRCIRVLAVICLWLPHFLPSLLPPLRGVQPTFGASGTYGIVLLAVTLWFLPDPHPRPQSAAVVEPERSAGRLLASVGDRSPHGARSPSDPHDCRFDGPFGVSNTGTIPVVGRVRSGVGAIAPPGTAGGAGDAWRVCERGCAVVRPPGRSVWGNRAR